MRLTRDELIWKALLAIDEVAEKAREGPVERSLFLRFTLAFLYCESDGGSLWVFREFWKSVTARCRPAATWPGARARPASRRG